ncbi:helix-turn-helix transcriptional regulator [Bifidobacterium sp. ESL0769]|uniref:helix-turn-helix domain-containing protein n=1 Tax=Bifidobacterium sp. ESL0769 TaxID=2983229 RepID=UPI0023F8F6C8|nr:helix-turn-helix transcriptional regulator [Bifidobacterium sp. ESL0769]WEV66772.1 helix-turn-helix transcriptional regulator [Bifidobacterium sp. ESL0769]
MSKNTPLGSWNNYVKELGLNLQRLRLERNLTQERVAYDAGLSRYTYQKFEKGESMPGTPANPSLHNIMAIAQVLGVSLEELLPSPWPDLRAK